ncbi:UNVERIFIED_CONTAM: hypothetical protein Slati_3691500 [Sesamum latifolium]|uniref:Uncharacterized protein n=1 Tax=Sesamum latifolium TaxID=2727402 RepID=A0AAW2U3A2_9LAMI
MKAEVNLLKCAAGREEDHTPSSKIARVPNVEKVSITSMYLMGDVKLWWRTRPSDDVSANHDKILTWDVLKKELLAIYLGFQGNPFESSNIWGVQDLPSAIAAADQLVDYKITSGADPDKKKKESGRDIGKADKEKGDCPKRGKLNTLVTEADDDDEGGSSSVSVS